jgi:hypothetical protein
MVTREMLQEWVLHAIQYHRGAATVVQVSKWVWDNHQADLEASGELFYRWQYDLRWAANRLRTEGRLKAADLSPRGTWELFQLS